MEEKQTNVIDTGKYVQEVYKDLSHYIVIGLTGRCGSGCSTVCDLLCEENGLHPEDFVGRSQAEVIHNRQRDENIIIEFATKNPIMFGKIKVRDILTSFILQNMDCFFELLNQEEIQLCGDGNKIREDFCTYFKEKCNLFSGKKEPLAEAVRINKGVWGSIEENVYRFIDNITEAQYNFLFTDTQKISGIIRGFLIKILGPNQYTVIYQHVGNIVRTYGSLNLTGMEESKPENVHAVVKRINLLLKIMRRKNWIEQNMNRDVKEGRDPIYKSNVYVVIDSLKNVFEAEYLKERYHSFYMIAMTLDDTQRKQRLKFAKGLDEEQITLIDAREQPSIAKRLITKYATRHADMQERQARKETAEFDKIGEVYRNDNITDAEHEDKDIKGARQGKNIDIEENVYQEIFERKNTISKLVKNAYKSKTYLFRLQDVDNCLQKADILINNGGTKEELRLKILRYICLMRHPGLVPPTTDERCMQIAQSAKLNSGCISRQVGAVISDKEGNILSIGWNDAVASNGNECISCVRRSFEKLVNMRDEEAYSYYEFYSPEFRNRIEEIMKDTVETYRDTFREDMNTKEAFLKIANEKLEGVPLGFCFKDIYCSITHDRNQVHTRAQHGEENALETVDRQRCEGGTLYTTSSSCELCAKKALGYSIKRMVYIEPYSGITNDHILGHKVENGVRIKRGQTVRTESMKVELFTGATQSAYIRLYTPLFPLKDELLLRGINLQ